MDIWVCLIVITIAAIISGIVLLIRHLCGYGDKERTKMSLFAAGFISALIIVVGSVQDIVSPNASRLSFVIVCGLLVIWAIWSYNTVEKKKADKAYYIFRIEKSHSISCLHPDHPLLPAPLKLSEFMNAYNMTEDVFESRIVLHGIQLAVQEYVDAHPEQLVYNSGISFDD